jgi:hypothetical protein
MITVKCAKCKKKVFKYVKIGKGKLWHCWKDRIIEDNAVRNNDEIKCTCGNLVGVDEGKWIKMKQHSFTYSGAIKK